MGHVRHMTGQHTDAGRVAYHKVHSSTHTQLQEGAARIKFKTQTRHWGPRGTQLYRNSTERARVLPSCGVTDFTSSFCRLRLKESPGDRVYGGSRHCYLLPTRAMCTRASASGER